MKWRSRATETRKCWSCCFSSLSNYIKPQTQYHPAIMGKLFALEVMGLEFITWILQKGLEEDIDLVSYPLGPWRISLPRCSFHVCWAKGKTISPTHGTPIDWWLLTKTGREEYIDWTHVFYNTGVRSTEVRGFMSVPTCHPKPIFDTLLKTNKDPDNGTLKDRFPLQTSGFQGLC